ncbi:MAG TPA: hypothetical protein VJN90_01305 [Candidatus Acidoferrales bacterium]|nr:hypothetical protein [Candidatus Acidoferrales bacterium]
MPPVFALEEVQSPQMTVPQFAERLPVDAQQQAQQMGENRQDVARPAGLLQDELELLLLAPLVEQSRVSQWYPCLALAPWREFH